MVFLLFSKNNSWSMSVLLLQLVSIILIDNYLFIESSKRNYG